MDGNTYAKGFEGPQLLGEEEKKLRYALEVAESEVRLLVQLSFCISFKKFINGEHYFPNDRFKQD